MNHFKHMKQILITFRKMRGVLPIDPQASSSDYDCSHAWEMERFQQQDARGVARTLEMLTGCLG